MVEIISGILNALSGLNIPFHASSLVPALIYMVLAYHILVFFREEDLEFNEHHVLSYLLVGFVFLTISYLLNWVHNAVILTQAPTTNLYYVSYALASDITKLPGYMFILVTVGVFYRRMSRI